MGAALQVSNASVPPARSRLKRRRTVVAASAAVLLAGLLATIITVRHLDHEYGPVGSGSFGGIYSAQNLVLEPAGPSGRLVGGPDATTQLLASLANAGSHSVEVTAIDTGEVVTDIRWSELHAVPGGVLSGLDTPWRDFPAVLPAHTAIRLLITIHRPMYCRTSQSTVGTDIFYSGSYRVHWKSLLRSHVTAVNDHIATIQLC